MASKITWEAVDLQAHPVLSPAWTYKDLVFASGSVGTEDDGSLSPDVERQTEKALLNLQKVLVAGGSSLNNCLKVTVFIANPGDVSQVNKVYATYFPTKPARSCFGVSFPNKELLVEIEAIAFKNPTSKL